MLVDDAINLISRDFANYKAGGRSVPINTPFANEKHPDAIQVLLNMLADNHQLTVLQYDRVIKYLEIKREEQVQVELGDVKDLPTTTTITVSDPKQAELQSRILNILNSNKTTSSVPAPSPVPAPTPAPTPVPPATWGAGKAYNISLINPDSVDLKTSLPWTFGFGSEATKFTSRSFNEERRKLARHNCSISMFSLHRVTVMYHNYKLFLSIVKSTERAVPGA